MQTPLVITTSTLTPTDGPGKIHEMAGQCAFALCMKGEMVVKILNERYRVSEHCILACMPFVEIEVMDVAQTCEIVIGQIMLKDVPMMINRWVSTDNLIAIQNHPVVRISEKMAERLTTAIDELIRECAEPIIDIQHDIIELLSKLIVAQVLKAFYSNIQMDTIGRTHRDTIFQQFMIDLYTHCREQRDVKFYALRSGVSLKYFSTLVKQLSGLSPSKWIETVLTGEAKSMLHERERSIKDIATTLHFPDAPTFTKYFHRVTGQTPKSYRNSL